MAAEVKARRGARRSASAFQVGFGRSYGAGSASEPVSAAEAEAEKIVKLLEARATAVRAEAVWADSTVEIAGAAPATSAAPESAPEPAPGNTALAVAGWTEPLTSTWSRRALAALLIPALILLIVILV
jgi:hypothetical protein